MHVDQYCRLCTSEESQASDQTAYEQYLLEQSRMYWALFDNQDANETENAADFAEYEQYRLEQSQKARALLSCPAAIALATSAATRLATLVTQHANDEGGIPLSDVLAETVAEHVVASAFEGRKGVLRQPVNSDGYRAIKSTVDRVCVTLEAALAAKVSKLVRMRLPRRSCLGNLTPLSAAMMSSAFLGETPHFYHATAFALIVRGIVLSSRH